MASQIFLTSTPSYLDGTELCEGVNVNLYCELSNVSASAFHWFLCEDECTIYALALPVIDGNGAVIVYDPIVGLEITIDSAVLTATRALSVISIMSFDLSIYNKEEVRTFRCGRAYNPESNNVTINIEFQSMTLSLRGPMPLYRLYSGWNLRIV